MATTEGRWFLHARALGTPVERDPVAVDLHVTGRRERMTERQREDMEKAMRFLLRASCAEPMESVTVAVSEMPETDDDYHEGGDPGGKVAMPQ